MNNLLKAVFKYKNRADIDAYLNTIKTALLNKEINYPLSYFLEAMFLYNLYQEAFLDEDLNYSLYAYKLKSVIELGNTIFDDIIFRKTNNLYSYCGKIPLKEFNELLGILIQYGQIDMLINVLTNILPHIKKAPINKNLYVSLVLLKYYEKTLPLYIGDKLMVSYLDSCEETSFYQSAREELKKVISLLQLPKKAWVMYLELFNLYDTSVSNLLFDFSQISLYCFKIIELSLKDFLSKLFSSKSQQEIYELLPIDIKKYYKDDTFDINRLELGKIYYLFLHAKKNKDEISLLIQNEVSIDLLEELLTLIEIDNINKYRNKIAHGDYLIQEQADEALLILDKFINYFLYQINKRKNNK